MSDVIDFLEHLGQDATLRHGTRREIEQALSSAQIDPALRAAILSGDQERIELLLGTKTNVCAFIFPVEEDEEEEEDDQPVDDDLKMQLRSAP